MVRDLNMDDLKDIVLPPGPSQDHLWLALIATCKRAKQIYDEEAAKEEAAKEDGEMAKEEEAKEDGEMAKEEEAERKSKKRKRENNVRAAVIVRPPQPPVPECVRKLMEETAREKGAPLPVARMVIQKSLSVTDLSASHNRLSIPFNKMAIGDDEFLTGAEKELLNSSEGEGKIQKKKYMNVTLFEPSMAPWKVKLTRWDMVKQGKAKTSTSYVLNGSWKYVVPRNKLREGTMVQLWTFRVAGDLYFPLLKV